MCFILCALCMCAYKQMAKVTHSFTIAAILELSQCVNSSQSPLRISKLSFRENQYMYLVNSVEEGLDPKTPLFDPAISKPGGSRMVDQRRSRLVQGRIHPGGCVGTISRVRNDHRTANGHKRPIYGLFEPFWGHKMGQNGWIKKGCLWIKPFQLTRYMYWFSRNENFEIRIGDWLELTHCDGRGWPFRDSPKNHPIWKAQAAF